MVDTGWSAHQDAILRTNVEDQYRGISTVLKKPLRWDSVAKQIPGMSAEQCQARWMALRSLPGGEHRGHPSLPSSHAAARFGGSIQARRGSPGGTRPPAVPGSRPATGAALTSASLQASLAGHGALISGSRPGSAALPQRTTQASPRSGTGLSSASSALGGRPRRTLTLTLTLTLTPTPTLALTLTLTLTLTLSLTLTLTLPPALPLRLTRRAGQCRSRQWCCAGQRGRRRRRRPPLLHRRRPRASGRPARLLAHRLLQWATRRCQRDPAPQP